MIENIKTIEQLENRGVLQIILILSNEKKLRASPLQKKMKGSSDVYYKARDMLEDTGLITKQPEAIGSYVTYTLTDKGRKIAGYLEHIVDVLS